LTQKPSQKRAKNFRDDACIASRIKVFAGSSLRLAEVKLKTR
jgi:hypothetical protein